MPNLKKFKTAAVYDRWLSTLGGGEQVAFAYAEVLRDLGLKTFILTHKKVDIEKAEKKMNVNLKNISIIYLPEKSSRELSEYSEEYDIFINTSYLDYFPNRAKLGILSVFFPGQIFLTPFEYIKRAFVLPSFQRFFIYPSRFEDFAFDEFRQHHLFKWMKKESKIMFNKDIRRLSLRFFMQDFSFGFWEETQFFINDERLLPIAHSLAHDKNEITFDFILPKIQDKTLQIVFPERPNQPEVALIKMTIPNLRYFAYNFFKTYFPKWEMRLHGGPGVTKLSDLESYHSIITISNFCQKWIKKYWGLHSDVLYPPANTNDFNPALKKKNYIIHVGRFFVTGHSKKQLDLVKVFKRIIDEHNITDWELHFVGSVHEGSKHQEYFQQVLNEAEGYPVHIHLDVPFGELKQLLAESKMYWHATGLDEDPNRSPILFEHFGITTVEAMASGCVPVVINEGGQPEIVQHTLNGYCWNNRQELLQYSLELIRNKKLLKEFSQKARERSHYFDKKQFAQRFEKLLTDAR